MDNFKKKQMGVIKKNLPPFFNDSFFVSAILIICSLILFYITFNFDVVPPILNRGIQPATFPKILLSLIFFLTIILYLLSLKYPWKQQNSLPFSFYCTLIVFVLFSVISKLLDFFLGLSFLSASITFIWGERRIFYIILIAIVFPLIVFFFFDAILNLRFPGGILTNLYYY